MLYDGTQPCPRMPPFDEEDSQLPFPPESGIGPNHSTLRYTTSPPICIKINHFLRRDNLDGQNVSRSTTGSCFMPVSLASCLFCCLTSCRFRLVDFSRRPGFESQSRQTLSFWFVREGVVKRMEICSPSSCVWQGHCCATGIVGEGDRDSNCVNPGERLR